MNELQKTEFELLKIFISICEKLETRYYLVCGSALGAVKYGGFIPWDDDVDVAMPREDYEVFLKNAPRLLPNGLFLQNFRSDPAFPQIFTKLRNSNTTYIEKAAQHLKINHGVFIDIFPLDGYPRGRTSRTLFELRKKMYCHLLNAAYAEPVGIRYMIEYKIKRLLGFQKRTFRIAERYDRMISAWKTSDSELWCNHGNWQGRLEYAPSSQYGDGIKGTFEGLEVRLPSMVHEYLEQKYGDYSAEPPLAEKVGHHYCTVCDCSRPYSEYVSLDGRDK